MMWRFAAIGLVALLTGCAGTGGWSSDGEANNDPRAADAKRINPNNQSVSDQYAPSSNLWIRIRDGFGMEPLNSPLEIQQVRWLSARPDYVNRSMARSSRYLFYIVQEVNTRNMPMEIALLPFVESAFNPQAKSTAKAMGIWQFMPATGKDFQLTQNVFRDERRDVLQSTDAALDYLQRLYQQFGSWDLALAAYNWGAGNVSKAQKRNLAKGLPTDYQSLKMPNETRNYVPKLMAYRAIVLDPEAYGITLPPLENHPYFIALDMDRDIDVDLVIKLAQIPPEEFHNLNPSFNKPVILGNTNQQILLPFGHAEVFQENLKKYTSPLSTWTAVRVNQTQYADDVAKALKVDVKSLRDINGVPWGVRIRAGSILLIPKKNAQTADVSEAMAETASLSLIKPAPVRKTSVSKAKKKVAKTKTSTKKVATKANNSAKKTASQHKSASTSVAKSAKSTNSKTPSTNTKVASGNGVAEIR
uniref:transglycosylase SLT domain-containing protein n=1 Tax=Polynucleobacter sp. TaxID=2029855 RepID=UPI004047EECC